MLPRPKAMLLRAKAVVPALRSMVIGAGTTVSRAKSAGFLLNPAGIALMSVGNVLNPAHLLSFLTFARLLGRGSPCVRPDFVKQALIAVDNVSST